MADYETRRNRHYDRVNEANAELRGVIEGLGHAVDQGQITAEQALAQIRAKQIKTQAAIDASWAEMLGEASA